MWLLSTLLPATLRSTRLRCALSCGLSIRRYSTLRRLSTITGLTTHSDPQRAHHSLSNVIRDLHVGNGLDLVSRHGSFDLLDKRIDLALGIR